MGNSIEGGQIRKGMKLEIDNTPFNVVSVDLVKPGKGQAFTRARIKNLRTGAVIEKTFKSNEKVNEADVEESSMRLLYQEAGGVVFMNDETYDQVTISFAIIGDSKIWLKEDTLYSVVFYKGEAVDFVPPTFMDLEITETMPGERGNTASGRVLKPATVETGAEVQVPIFIEQGEKVRIDTRTGEYVSRI